MYEAAQAQGVRVLLDGFDGDSTVSHGFEWLAELGQTFRWARMWKEVRLLSENHLAGIRPWKIMREYCVKPLLPRWAHLGWHLWKGRRAEALADNVLISEPLKRRTGIERRARRMLSAQSGWRLRSARQRHYLTLTQALYAYTLEIADKASAAFGVEGRYPFFDRRLMEFCLSLPANQKLGAGWNRWILRRAMQGILPPSIQWRPSKGNLSPNFHRRLLDFERNRLEEVALRDTTLEPYVDRDAMRAVYRQYEKAHVSSGSESIQIFAAANLAFWLRSTGFSS
jgi:asparagine synthase (glutamine-hydrolysing)